MLYALPDHEVMESLLPEIRNRYRPPDDALQQLQNTPGLVPVAVNPAGSALVYFADIGTAPLREWKHIYTVKHLVEAGLMGGYFCTDLDILEHEGLPADGILPQGLIFHVSRCGSTLLTKVLARSPANLTINQGGPLQEGFWAAVTDHWRHEPVINERNIRMFRNLVQLMARRRRPEYRRCFIKFISWNIIYHDFIRAAYPDAAAVYLYRDPVEVIATVLQETTAVLRAKGNRHACMLTGMPAEDTGQMSDIEYLAHCYAHYFRVALQTTGTGRLQLVNYARLKHSGLLADILARGLDLRPDEPELDLMREQYRYYSKDDTDRKLFSGDDEALLDVLTEADRQLIRQTCDDNLAQLDTSPRNLYPLE